MNNPMSKTRSQKIIEIEDKFGHGGEIEEGLILHHIEGVYVVCQMFSPKIKRVDFTIYEFYKKYMEKLKPTNKYYRNRLRITEILRPLENLRHGSITKDG